MMDDEITIAGVAALLTQLAAVQMERDEERARADAAEAERDALATEQRLTDCRDDLKTVVERAEDVTKRLATAARERDALAAEVEWLTADNTALQEELSRLAAYADEADEIISTQAAQLAAANKWRSVSEPPPTPGHYLTSTTIDKDVYISEFSGTGWYDEVDYWQPLPALPQE